MKWYKYDIRDLTQEEYEQWYSLMSFEKKQRVDRFRFMDDKKRTVVGEMLARKAIAEWCHVSEEDIKFGLSEYGKPFAIGLDVEFNISHSGDLVVCAVDNKPVGIDCAESSAQKFQQTLPQKLPSSRAVAGSVRSSGKARPHTSLWRTRMPTAASSATAQTVP